MNDVWFASSPDYEEKNIVPALERVLVPQLEKCPVRGKKIMLKPNLLAWRKQGDIACVHPSVILHTARLFLDAGAAKVDILENPAVQTAPSILHAMGIDEILKKWNVGCFNFEKYTRVPEPEGLFFHNLELASEYLEYDHVCDIAKAKTHGMMTLTLCVKNLFGFVKGADRMAWHLNVGRDYRSFAMMLLDLYRTVKPDFNLLDGVVCMEGNGPGSGTPAQRNFLAGSRDALALDASVTALFGIRDLPLLRCAAERKLDLVYENRGEVPCPEPLKLPDPPGLFTEWGTFLPPGLKTIFRDSWIARPVLDADKCIGCGLCVKMCPPKSLKLKNGKPAFDLPNCIRCYCCQEHCPQGAIRPVTPAAVRFARRMEDLIRGIFRKQ